jgi:ribonuclease G
MPNQIIVNVTGSETRVALMEKGALAEFYSERPGEKSVAGNIYKGKVVKVLPGMQASFVDIGLERNAFLYVSDIQRESEEFERMVEDSEDLPARPRQRRRFPSKSKIENLVKEGEEILVQVAKEPLEAKGARVTTHISIPGRYLVLMPTFNRIGVSRRIDQVEERKRLRHLLNSFKPSGLGFIIRTAARGVGGEEIRLDLESNLALWQEIQKRRNSQPAPVLLREDLDLPLRVIRDFYSPEIKKIIFDSSPIYAQAREYFQRWVTSSRKRKEDPIELYTRSEPIFDHYGIERELDKAIKPRVWLKSGGHIVIEEAEALTTIDVNTGKYVGKRNPEETILKTNLEAAKEIAYQLRLRSIGGIIIVDFIDMEKESHRNKVYHLLQESLKKDRARVNILRISEFGLVEMTRERGRRSIMHSIGEPCFYCEGSGFIKSSVTIGYEIYREIQREINNLPRKKITILVHPDLAELLAGEEHHILDDIKQHFTRKVGLKSKPELHREEFVIV